MKQYNNHQRLVLAGRQVIAGLRPYTRAELSTFTTHEQRTRVNARTADKELINELIDSANQFGSHNYDFPVAMFCMLVSSLGPYRLDISSVKNTLLATFQDLYRDIIMGSYDGIHTELADITAFLKPLVETADIDDPRFNQEIMLFKLGRA